MFRRMFPTSDLASRHWALVVSHPNSMRLFMGMQKSSKHDHPLSEGRSRPSEACEHLKTTGGIGLMCVCVCLCGDADHLQAP